MVFGKMKATVILPAKDEEPTIAKVVRIAKKIRWVDEVIVIDSYSTDDTANRALKAGAEVVALPPNIRAGKGTAMKCGLKLASNDAIVFFDADILNIKSTMIQKLIKPIARGQADFVKGVFDREGGRVTESVAKPLLRIFFPEATKFSQPLGGEIAGKRRFFERIELEDDWGVDVGILLDALELRVRIQEVHLGFIRHFSKPLSALHEMAHQVSVAILKRAKVRGRWTVKKVRELREIEAGLEEAIREVFGVGGNNH